MTPGASSFSRSSLSSYFPTAYVCTVSSNGRKSAPRLVRLAIASRIYFKENTGENVQVPTNLMDFRGSNSLEIVRLWSATMREDINRTVKPSTW